MEKALMPEYTTAVGDDLMQLQKGEGHRVHIMGVPRAMSDIALMSCIQRASDGWKIRPIGPGPKCDSFGRKNVLALAVAPPPRSTLILKVNRENFMVLLKLEVRRTKQQEAKNLGNSWGQEGCVL